MTSPNELDAAVERLKQSRDRARLIAERGDIMDPNAQLAAMAIEASRYANAIDTILDALASITRERDAMRAGINRAIDMCAVWADHSRIAEHLIAARDMPLREVLSAALVNGEVGA